MYERWADVCDFQSLRVGNSRYLPVNFLKIIFSLYRGELLLLYFRYFLMPFKKNTNNDDGCLLIFNRCPKRY